MVFKRWVLGLLVICHSQSIIAMHEGLKIHHPQEAVVADCLVQNAYGTSSPILPQKMGEGISYLIPLIRQKIDDPSDVTPNTIEAWLNQLAKIRKEIAITNNVFQQQKYGLALPSIETEMPQFIDSARLIPISFSDFRITDVIGRNDNPVGPPGDNPLIPFFEGHRHSYLYSRAMYHHFRQERSWPLWYSNGQILSLTKLEKVRLKTPEGQYEYIYAVHPSLKEMAVLRKEAYTILAYLITNHHSLNENQILDCLAKAHFLLMHAQPFYRGTPAIIESYIDAYLRAALGKRLGKKRSEPFWEVMFWDLAWGDYRGADFLRNFR